MLGLPTGDDDTGFGQFFLMVCYGFILFKAAVFIGDGSEKLLLLYGAGIVGGLVIPILGAVPDGAIVLFSGLGGNAQCSVSTGVGTLAGSTIMLLTIPWGVGTMLGARDYDANIGGAKTERPKYSGFTLMNSCITTFQNTVSGAKIMMVTALSYLIVTIPAVIYKNKSGAEQASKEHGPALAGIIVTGVLFILYSLYQYFDSQAQITIELKQKKAQYMKWKDSVAHKFGTTRTAIRMVFDKFDKDKSGKIDAKELRAGFAQLGLELDRNEVQKMLKDMNSDDDDTTLTFDEFVKAIKSWQAKLVTKQSTVDFRRVQSMAALDMPNDDIKNNNESSKNHANTGIQSSDKTALLNHNNSKYMSIPMENNDVINQELEEIKEMFKELEELEEENEEEEEQFLELTDSQLLRSALLDLFIGTLLCVIFSDPMVDVINNFSNKIGVNPFFVSFIITPIASNAAEIYSSLIFASKKTTEGISMGFSALYGAACMNNTFVLCIFCILVYVQKLEWVFIVETIVILLTIYAVGIMGLRKNVYNWQAIIVICIFPLSLVIVALLENALDDKVEGC